MTDKIREAFSKEVWSDTVWEGCGPTALDIYEAGYQARDSELRAELEAAKKDAEQWRAREKKKQELISLGFLRSPLRSEPIEIDQAIKEKP